MAKNFTGGKSAAERLMQKGKASTVQTITGGDAINATNTDNADITEFTVITDIPVIQIPQYPQVTEISKTQRKRGRKPKDRVKRDFKTSFLVPHELYERLKECAWLERMTLNDVANIALENYCDVIEAKHKK